MNPVNRFERQRDLVPLDRLQDLSATVIGVGAIGRQVALQLGAIGVRRLQLIDFDTVELTNVTTQGYHLSDVGLPKVVATRRAVEALDPELVVETISDRFRARQQLGEALFCSVDSIGTRAAIWRAVEDRCRFFVDGRMLGEVIRVLAAADELSRAHYATTLFAPTQAQAGRCTARSTIYTANIAAGLMLHQFARWLRGLRVDADCAVNLLAGEWSAMSTEHKREVTGESHPSFEKGVGWERERHSTGFT